MRLAAIKDDYMLIGKRFAGGAMGAIYPVKRRADQKLMIGKMIIPKDQYEREKVKNEI